jgi:predicted  nucleic acid-binding Zn-ribbon protein
MTFSCSRCGEEWDTDPRLAVACPDCGAAPGLRCIRPSGHRLSSRFGGDPHRAREQAAVDAGVLPMCTAFARPSTMLRAEGVQGSLF